MEKVESALDVLSRAATMVQPCPYPSSDSEGFETPSTGSSESEGDRTQSPPAPRPPAPGKWRRDRKAARLPEYRPRENGTKASRSQSLKERRATPARARASAGSFSDEDAPSPAASGRGAPPEYPGPRHEAPIDMRLRARPAPPPYSRVSVITKGQEPAGSMSMCDPVIDEHFRRSLGDDYMTLFKKDEPRPAPKPHTEDRASSPIQFHKVEPAPAKIIAMEVDDANLSVDDHFAKALGDTWRQIQTSRSKPDEPAVSPSKVVDDHFSQALGDRWKELQSAKKKGDDAKITSRNGVVI